MSGFDVKDPIRKAVFIENFHYSSVEEIYHFVNKFFKGNGKKHYVLLTEKDISQKRKTRQSLVLKDCMEFTSLPFTQMVLFKLRSTCACVLNVFKGILLFIRAWHYDVLRPIR